MNGFFLVPESTVWEQGKGDPMNRWTGESLVTLGILSVEEQESLHVALWHSPDGTDWGIKPIAQFAQKFYPGTHQLQLASGQGYLQARWQVNRWGRGDLKPSFRFYVFVEAM